MGQENNKDSTSFPPPAAAYQPNPPAQAWSGPAQSQYPPPQQYGPPAPQYNYSQPPQPYNAPTPPQPYNRPGYQPTSYSQYAAPTGPLQYGTQGYQAPQQSYVPPAAAPYQPAPNNYPAQTPNYGSNFQTPKPYQAQPPPPKWNESPRAPYPRQNRSTSVYSNTPSQHSLQQVPQQQNERKPSLQSLDYGSEGHLQNQPIQRPSQAPVPNFGSSQPTPAQNHVTPAIAKHESKAASVASTPKIQEESTIVVATSESKPEEPASNNNQQEVQEQDEKPEEGELTAEDDEEEAFLWDLEHAFEAIEPKETVALAQPLSASFKSTPVPLIQAWSVKIPSISRYARKDNLKEYVRPIRTSPQWSYLQEDPAFSDADMDGSLIPFEEVAEWMATRHGKAQSSDNEDVWENPRKRSRDEEDDGMDDEQDDVDNQIAHEVASEIEAGGPPLKRHKSQANLNDAAMGDGETTGSPPLIIPGPRGGTPCLGAIDDEAWAPQPGEGAEPSPDMTEALLASLGVSGEAKPVTQTELPPYVPIDENMSPMSRRPSSHSLIVSQHSISVPPSEVQPKSALANQGPSNQNNPMMNGPSHNQGQTYNQGPPQNQGQNQGPPMNNGYVTVPQDRPHQYGPPVNTSYGGNPAVQNQYQNRPPTNVPYPSAQYGPPANAPYNNAPPPTVPYGNAPPPNVPYAAPAVPQYGPPANSYPAGPPNNYPQGPQQYGPPQNNGYGNAPQYHGLQPYNQYGPPVQAPYPPYQQQQPQYGPPANQPYGNAPPVNYPQGPPQYGPPQNSSYGAQPIPGPYGPNMQTSPAQYGPPQNAPYNANPYPNPQYSSGPGAPVPPYSSAPPNSAPYQNGPPAQQPYGNNMNGNGPSRQDSGYDSAGGSFSTAPGPNPNDPNYQNSVPMQAQQQSQPNSSQGFENPQGHPTQNGSPIPNGQGSAPQTQADPQQPPQQPESGADSKENAIEEKDSKEREPSPLSELEKELLGKLEMKPEAPTRRNPPRKVSKKPQPVVEAAYKYVSVLLWPSFY